MGVAVGLVMGSDMGSVIVYYMGSVYSKVALCEWVRTMSAKKVKAIVCNTSVPANDPYIFPFPSSSTFLFSCQLTFKLVTSHISDLIFMFFFLSDNIYIFALALSPMFCPQRLPLPLPSILSWNIRGNRGQGQGQTLGAKHGGKGKNGGKIIN